MPDSCDEWIKCKSHFSWKREDEQLWLESLMYFSLRIHSISWLLFLSCSSSSFLFKQSRSQLEIFQLIFPLLACLVGMTKKRDFLNEEPDEDLAEKRVKFKWKWERESQEKKIQSKIESEWRGCSTSFSTSFRQESSSVWQIDFCVYVL